MITSTPTTAAVTSTQRSSLHTLDSLSKKSSSELDALYRTAVVSSSPATESGIRNQGGTGTVDQAKLKRLVDSWGTLPPREQARALQELTQGMSQRHREAIENYFRNIANAQSRK